MCSITFLVPIKSAKYINDKNSFDKILARTLKFLQRIPDSNIIIICNEDTVKTEIQVEHTLTIVETYLGYGDEDKEYKVLIGSKYWLNKNLSTHMMIVDCDDIVLLTINSIPLKTDTNVVMMSGYQKVFNRIFLYKPHLDFYYRCGTSLIFSQKYVRNEIRHYTSQSRWMFHQTHDLTQFVKSDIPCVIHIPWNGENIWWKKQRVKDYFKFFLSTKFEF